MTPALATQAIFSFLGSWNNFFAPSILLSRPEDKTLPLMVAQLYGDRFVDYGAIYVGLSASILPIIIVYAFMQRYIISGVAAGGVRSNFPASYEAQRQRTSPRRRSVVFINKYVRVTI